jgi:hypothetical protein
MPNSCKTPKTQSLPQTREMHIRTTIHRIPQSTSKPRHSTHGRRQSRKGPQMASPLKCHRSLQIPWVHGLLLLLHKRLFKDSETSPTPHTQHNPLAMGQRATASLRNTVQPDVPTTSLETTRFHQTIRRIHRRIGIWRGSHTLTRGWTQRTKLNQIPSNCLLFGHFHRNRTELRRLRQRIASNHESNHTLAPLSYLDKGTIQNLYRPHKPPTLEIPSQIKSSHSQMAWRTPGLQLHTPPRTWEEPHGSRHPITSPWS